MLPGKSNLPAVVALGIIALVGLAMALHPGEALIAYVVVVVLGLLGMVVRKVFA